MQPYRTCGHTCLFTFGTVTLAIDQVIRRLPTNGLKRKGSWPNLSYSPNKCLKGSSTVTTHTLMNRAGLCAETSEQYWQQWTIQTYPYWYCVNRMKLPVAQNKKHRMEAQIGFGGGDWQYHSVVTYIQWQGWWYHSVVIYIRWQGWWYHSFGTYNRWQGRWYHSVVVYIRWQGQWYHSTVTYIRWQGWWYHSVGTNIRWQGW